MSFSFETTLSARSNNTVITLCFADVGLCDGVMIQVLVCMHWFSVDYYRDGFVMISLDKVSRNGRVELFSSSLVNCVWGCKLLMCSSRTCR